MNALRNPPVTLLRSLRAAPTRRDPLSDTETWNTKANSENSWTELPSSDSFVKRRDKPYPCTKAAEHKISSAICELDLHNETV